MKREVWWDTTVLSMTVNLSGTPETVGQHAVETYRRAGVTPRPVHYSRSGLRSALAEATPLSAPRPSSSRRRRTEPPRPRPAHPPTPPAQTAKRGGASPRAAATPARATPTRKLLLDPPDTERPAVRPSSALRVHQERARRDSVLSSASQDSASDLSPMPPIASPRLLALAPPLGVSTPVASRTRRGSVALAPIVI